MAITCLEDQLARDEGREPEAYPDPLSPLGQACAAMRLSMREYRRVANWQEFAADPWTIAVGHTGPEVHQGLVWTDAQIDSGLASDIAKHDAPLYANAPWVHSLDDARLGVLRNMSFNMGWKRLSGFKNMLAAAQAGLWNTASAQMLDSAWARQVGDRAQRLAKQMLDGIWQ